MFGSDKEYSINRLETKVTRLSEDKHELIDALRGLLVPIQGITNAWTPESSLGIACKVLEKHGRYWK